MTIEVDEIEATERDVLLRALRRDLLRSTDIDAVTLSGGSAPPGSKAAGDLFSTLAVELSGATVSAVIAFVGGWLVQRRKMCRITYRLPNGVEFELPGGVELKDVMDQLPSEVRTLIATQ